MNIAGYTWFEKIAEDRSSPLKGSFSASRSILDIFFVTLNILSGIVNISGKGSF